MADVERLKKYLNSSELPNEQKANIWDALNSGDRNIAYNALNGSALDEKSKADLWDLANAEPPPQKDFGAKTGSPSLNAFLNTIGRTGAGFAGIVSPQFREMAQGIPHAETKGAKVTESLTNIGLMLAPGSAGTKWAQAINNPLLRGAARIGTESGITGLIGAAEAGGDIKSGIRDAEITAGMGAFAGVAGSLMSKFGKNIQMKGLMPRKVDWQNGFSWENVKKLGLKGNLMQSYKQVTDKLAELRLQRSNIFRQIPGLRVDVGDAIGKAKFEISSKIGSKQLVGREKQVANAFRELTESIQKGMRPDGTLPLEFAENAKESLGILGSWFHNPGAASAMRDLEASGIEEAANTLYTQLRLAIEKSIPNDAKKLKELNAAMGELIPIRNAMISRIPVEERNSMISLSEIAGSIPWMMSGNPVHAAIPLLIHGQKSMRLGNFLIRTAPNVPQAGINIGRVLSAEQ